MKITNLTLAFLAAAAVGNISAVNQEDLDKFQKTGTCNKCDLSGIDLRSYLKNLRFMNKSIDLSNSDLSWSNMADANLRAANLNKCKLTDANLSNADLTFAHLDYADARYANFSKAILDFASLSKGNFTHANFENAKIDCSFFNRADVSEAKFNGATILGAIFEGTKGFSPDFRSVTWDNQAKSNLRYAQFVNPLFFDKETANK